MNVIRKAIEWIIGLKAINSKVKLKWHKKGHLARGSIRKDGMVLYNTWLLVDGTRNYQWITQDDYNSRVTKHREYVRKHYYKKKNAK